MAITKVGENFIKTGGFWSTAWDKTKNAGRTAMRFGFPLVTTALTASEIASGDSSVGGALGSLAGSTAGYFGTEALVNKGFDKFFPHTNPNYSGLALPPKKGFRKWLPGARALRGVAGFALPLLASLPTEYIGRELGNKIIPYRRIPDFENYKNINK